MIIHRRLSTLRVALRAQRSAGKTVAFVPTMGFLHPGHVALMKVGLDEADTVVVSVFVNPTQFGHAEDLESYPRDFDADSRLCEAEGVAHLFVPDDGMMYPEGFSTVVRVDRLTDGLCGIQRPGHFEGVTTVVAKLFNMVQPDVALFGEKDFQQLMVIRQMVADLNMPIKISGVPTVRESDGLALSSRNKYLSPKDRVRAARLYAILQDVQASAESGVREVDVLRKQVLADLDVAGFETEYAEFVDPETLASVVRIDRPVRLLVAARLGTTRLIDNVALRPGSKV